MDSLAGNNLSPQARHMQARKALRLMLESRFDERLGCNVNRIDWQQEEQVLPELSKWCAVEIFEAASADPASWELCGLLAVEDHDAQKYRIVGNLALVVKGLRQAVRVLIKDNTANAGVAVRSCISAVIREEKDHRAAHLNKLKPRELLGALASTTPVRAALLINFLNQEQQHALSRLLYIELDNRPRLLPMDRCPKLPANPTVKQRYAWLHWYLWCREMHKPERQKVVGGVPQVVLIADGDRMLTNRSTGQLADPLGPIHAPVWRALGRELNKHGHPIKDPESENKIAKSIGVSRDKLRTFPELPIKITPDGKGGVRYEFTGGDLLKAIEASSRKRPGKNADS